MSVLSQNADLAYASKPNIQRPGSQTDADTAEASAATRFQDENPTVTLDTADLSIVANAESTKYTIPHGSN